MLQTRVIDRGGRRWHILPEAAEPLLADGWPPDDPSRLRLVKRGRRRDVFRFTAAGRDFFLKAYTESGLPRRIRARLGFGPARREWRALDVAASAGIDVPRPVALAAGSREALVTEAVPEARRLDEYLFERYFETLPGDPPYPGARPPELVAVFRRRRTPPEGSITPSALAAKLADVVARLAEANLFLPDLHPGNLLVAGSGDAWRLVLVDLAEAESPAPPQAVLEHLARLEHFFEPIATAAERLRCHRHLADLLPGTPDGWLVAQAAAAYRRRFYASRDRRTRREAKYFRRLRVACGDESDWRGWATADWAEAAESLLAAGNEALDPGEADLKDGRSASVRQVELPGGRTLVLKRDRRAAERPLTRLRASRSLRSFRNGHALLIRSIATARPAAAVDRRSKGRPAETLLLTEPVPGGVALNAYLRDGPAPADRRRLTRRLARLIRQLHAAGFSHRDLKAPNIVVATDPPDEPRPFLVDLDGLRRRRHVSEGRRARDLMRLGVSLEEWDVARATDRLRFLRAYLGRPGRPPAMTTVGRRRGTTEPGLRLRRWWRRIARAARRKRAVLRQKRGTLRIE